MKRVLIAAGMLLASVSVPTMAAQGFGVGLQVGSQSGINLATRGWQFNLGLNNLSFTADRLYNSPKHSALYYGLGGVVAPGKNIDIGARALIGARAYLDQIEFYGNLAPTLYVLEQPSVNLEANLGFRVHF